MKIRKNDNVLVTAGKDRGKKGKVRYAYPEKGRGLVGGINFIKRHSKARGATRQAGIVERGAPINASNVMQVPHLKKIVLNIGLGEAIQNQKALEAAERDLAAISGQHPVTTRARKSIAAFKLRAGMPIGLKVA